MSKIVLLFVLFVSPLAVMGQSSPAGQWEGSLSPAPGVSMRMVFNIADENGTLSSTLDSPDQGALGITVDSTTFEEGHLILSLNAIGGKYMGQWVDGAIQGTWSQAGQSFPLNLVKVDPSSQGTLSETEQVLIGDWIGTLQVNATSLRLVFHIDEYNGALTSSMDSPDQGVMGVPANPPTLEGSSISIGVPAVGGVMEGTISNNKEEIAGTWSQAGQSWDIVLERSEESVAPNRPQEPQRPYPYEEEEVTFEVPEGGHTLAGTLTLPEGVGPFPAAILISGSGPQDRDETLMGHKPFLVLSDYLTQHGIAVLRYDDRGTAASTGDHSTATSADFAHDAAAAVAYLRTHPRIDQSKLGLVGHSEGGLIAPMVAIDSDAVAYIVMMAGPGMMGKELLPLQIRLIAKAGGANTETLEASSKINTQLIQKAASLDPNSASTRTELKTFLEQETSKYSPEILEALEYEPDQTDALINRLTNPWMHYFLNYDPIPTLKKIDIPVLSIFGEKDLQVPPTQNASLIQDALVSGGNPHAETLILPGLNHLFQTSETGSPSEYGAIEETLAPAALVAISEWIKKVVE